MRKTRFKVTKNQIEFYDSLGNIVIPAGGNIKFIFYKTTQIFRGEGDPIYSAMLLADNSKITSRFPYPFKKSNKNPVFFDYKGVKELIKEIKKNNFPTNWDLSLAEDVLNKPLLKHTMVSKEGVRIISDDEAYVTKDTSKNILNFYFVAFFIILILLLIPLIAMQFTDEVVWDLTDFVVAGILLVIIGLSAKLLTKNINKRNIIYFALLVPFGILLFVFGGYDDSPGGQLLGLVIAIIGIVGIVKKKNKK